MEDRYYIQALLSSRVENVRDGVKKIKHYSSNQRILLVGEGDFSFATCLARAFGSATNLVATSLDSQADLKAKYSGAMANVKELKERGCCVLHGVSARTMHKHPTLSNKMFDRIVFNFPYAGLITWNQSSQLLQITVHKRLVTRFLKSAKKMVASGGEVHVTHKTEYPYSELKMEELAEEEGLRMVEEARFYQRDFPGYRNRRGDGGPRSFRVGEASTFKFIIDQVN